MWEHLNTQGGDRVSTISLLGCSTSVALATGPTDEEEHKRGLMMTRLVYIIGETENGAYMQD